MGKHSKRGKSSAGSEKNDHHHHQPGCMGGMLHVLDYHHWGNKLQRKHQQRTICWENPRTYSLEHEASEQKPFLESKKDDAMKPAVKESKKSTNKDFSQEQVKDYVDILEILNANKVEFVKILKDPSLGFGKQFHIEGIQGRLVKSGSFPVAGSSRALSLTPITDLEHKKKENWSAPKGSSLVLTLDAPILSSAARLKEDQESIAASSQEQKPSLRRNEDNRFNHIVMHGFREIKKWIKKALHDRKHKKKHDSSRTSLHEKGDSENDLRSRMKRRSSLNDSLERYSLLFEQSFRRDVKFHSKSLKVMNEDDKIALRGNHPKFFRRISSLSSVESFGSFLTEISRDSTISSNLEIRTSLDHDIERKSRFQEYIKQKTESRESADLPDRQIASESHKENPMATDFPDPVVPSEKEEDEEEEEEEEAPVSVPETLSFDDTPRMTETLFSEGLDPIHYSNSNKNLQELWTTNKIQDQHYKPNEDENDPYFCYLKDILQLSGFLTNSEKWHSEDQLIDPSLIFKLKPHEHEELNNNQLLFDLVNEASADTYNQYHIYFPKAFSFTRRIYPMPDGEHLLDEVWGRIQRTLFGLWANKEDCSLDDLVAEDLAKADGWMNVQVEAELLALEIEDVILDEIFDELVCTC